MLYLAFIWHMHQPYYKDILTQEIELPWVRLHGTKDYLDMVKILEGFPKIKQTFNLVPSLIEQIDDYTQHSVKDKFLKLSEKNAAQLSQDEKAFILENFFMADVQRIVAIHPRYYELYLKKNNGNELNTQDFLDLQVWFNLGWIDPSFRKSIPEISKVVEKGRFFSEEDKAIVLTKQIEILKEIIPTYNKFYKTGQIEITISPYFHPILPLIYNTKTAKEANLKTKLPENNFSYPNDVAWQINQAVIFFKKYFEKPPQGMWPSEEAVSRHIIPFLVDSGINWIVSDETLLFKSLRKKRNSNLLYKPYKINYKDKSLNIIFRDANLSNLIGFVYHRLPTNNAVDDLLGHLNLIAKSSVKDDCLVTIALDGENAWEYYPNDGIDFLSLLYERLSNTSNIQTITVSEFLKTHPAKDYLTRLSAGSWIEGNFNKWIGTPQKNIAWQYLAKARERLETILSEKKQINLELAFKQIYAAEGSDWFWWLGENHGAFDNLFRKHLTNFYKIINEPSPDYLLKPISIDTK
ncbi:MAG: glycoside hydrolase family 57 protein [Candidatus Omnitrophota bacterium]|nr:glycoside hydrolase family 57 protein [Candidatus Omnitrophota bacterium]